MCSVVMKIHAAGDKLKLAVERSACFENMHVYKIMDTAAGYIANDGLSTLLSAHTYRPFCF